MNAKTAAPREPYIWLQDDETQGRADCGCTLNADGWKGDEAGAALFLCPLHEAAADLLGACKAQQKAIDVLFAMVLVRDNDFLPSKSGKPWTALQLGNQAIEKATPPKPREPDWFA